MKRSLKSFAALMLSAAMLSACSGGSGSTDNAGSSAEGTGDIPKVGVAQIVSHNSLNTIRDSFADQMEELGYKDGETIEISYADAANQMSNLTTIMQDFSDNGDNVIVAIATPTAQAAANYADEIPVIFSAVSDPVGAGLVKDPEKPDGNITGTSDEVQVDQILALAKQLYPDLKKVGVLYNASEANSVSNIAKAKEYAKANGIEIVERTGKDASELQTAETVLIDEGVEAIFSPNDNTVAQAMTALAKVAEDAKIPYFTGADSMVQDGGFATVGINYVDLGKETANMVDKVLKGTKVEDIPVMVFKDNLNIYINQAYLDKLGLELPDDVKNNDQLVMVDEQAD